MSAAVGAGPVPVELDGVRISPPRRCFDAEVVGVPGAGTSGVRRARGRRRASLHP